MRSGKIVLISKSGYQPSRDTALLREIVEDKVELFCVVGVDADKWEDALDWLCVGGSGEDPHFIVTTAHLDESEEEVIEFAHAFVTERVHQVEIIRI